MDVRAAVFNAIAAEPRYRIIEFSTWPLLLQFRATPAPNLRDMMVRPDAFLRISERDADGGESEQLVFRAVDRGTEVQQTLATKAACYGDYYRRGGLADHTSRQVFQDQHLSQFQHPRLWLIPGIAKSRDHAFTACWRMERARMLSYHRQDLTAG
jgi:hypothetical protein